MSTRIHPRVVLRRESPNQSSRNGATPRLITIHSTESENRPGVSDLQATAGWLCSTPAAASSHVIVDADAQSARLVSDSRKAWTQAWFNPWCLSIEQIGRAAQKEWERDELRETARWVARWSLMHDIPPYKAKVDLASGRILRAGVIRHSELGARGGNHHDPGAGYPMDKMLALARFYRARLKG